MRQDCIQFEFADSVPMEEVDATLRLSLLALESLHGAERVRLEVEATLNWTARTCAIDTGGEVGRALAAVFSGYLRREFGDEAFSITRPLHALAKAGKD